MQTLATKLRYKLIAPIFFLGFSILSAFANSPVTELTQILTRLTSFQAQFQQIVIDNQKRVLQRAQGQVALKRPQLFHWELQTPTPQIVIGNGRKLWFYEPDLKQVRIASFKQTIARTPAEILLGSPDSFRKKYSVHNLPQPTKDVRGFLLIPYNKQGNFTAVRLFFKQQRLVEMDLMDKLEQTTKVQFNAIKINAPLDNKQFNFIPPPGVDVLGDY
ncbi:MAG: outer membrane lipoprotein chaperone LolA [Gammaproteobacteria bacterium]